MTPISASPHRTPAAEQRRRRPPDHTLVRSSRRTGPLSAPTSASLGARDRTLCHLYRDRAPNQAVARRHQTGPLYRPRPAAIVKSP
jgi:hypothetical protein